MNVDQQGGQADVSCGCDMKNPLPAYAYSLDAARDVKGGFRKTRKRKQYGGTPMKGAKRYTKRGGGCGCVFKGGYKPTQKNRNALAKFKRGESIGFTMEASLKAKGLIPRTNKNHYGKKIVSNKYK